MRKYIECSAPCLNGVKCTQPATKRSGYRYCHKHEAVYRKAEKGSMTRTGHPTGLTSTIDEAMEKFIKDPHIHNLRSEVGVLRTMLSEYLNKDDLSLAEKEFVRKLIKEIKDTAKASQELEEKRGYLISAVYLQAMIFELGKILQKYISNQDTLATIIGEIKRLPWREVTSFDNMDNRYINTAPMLENPQMNVEHVDLDKGEKNESGGEEEETSPADE